MGRIPVRVATSTFLADFSRGILVTRLKDRSWDLCSEEKYLDIQSFNEFHSGTLCREVSSREILSGIISVASI